MILGHGLAILMWLLASNLLLELRLCVNPCLCNIYRIIIIHMVICNQVNRINFYQNLHQVRVRIGSPITGYGQESRNRAARQRIPNRMWTDEDGNEHVEVNFYVRGPHGAGKVGVEMFKDNMDKKWKFTYLIVDIRSPSPAQLLLESYVPA